MITKSMDTYYMLVTRICIHLHYLSNHKSSMKWAYTFIIWKTEGWAFNKLSQGPVMWTNVLPWHSHIRSTRAPGHRAAEREGCPTAAGGTWLPCRVPVWTGPGRVPHPLQPEWAISASHSCTTRPSPRSPNPEHLLLDWEPRRQLPMQPQLAQACPREVLSMPLMNGSKIREQNPTQPFSLDFETLDFLGR